MADPNPTPYELRILGAPDLRGPDGRRVTSVLSQPSRLGLLAYLTLAPRPVARSSVVADFWPESDESRARNALSQAVFYLRRSLGKDAIRSVEGDRLWVSPEAVWCDARELLNGGRPTSEVVDAASGELLAGWNAESSQPLQDWLDGMRRRVEERSAEIERERAEERKERAAEEALERSGPNPTDEPGVGTGAAGGTPGGAVSRGDANRSSEDSSRAASSWTPRDLRLRTTAALLMSVVTLALVAVLILRGRPTVAASPANGAATLAVLLPRVESTAAGVPDIDALTLNAELLVDLPPGDGLDVVSLPTANSLQTLMSQRSAIGATADMPDWILDVGVGVSQRAAHVQWVLYRGADRAVYGADSFDEPITGSGAPVIDVTRAIADEVAGAVREILR